MTTPAIAYTGPTVDSSVPFEVRRHLQLIYQKLGNHTQAFQLQQAKINAIKGGNSTTIVEGGSGGGSIIPFTPQPGIPVNNQSGVTSYSTVTGDNGALIVLSDASPIAVSLTPESPPFGVFICNQGAGTATLTPSPIGAVTPTISYTGNPGASSMPLLSGYGCLMGFDGSSWFALTMPIVPLSFSVISHEFLTSYDAATGDFTAAQPAYSDISGTPQLPNTIADVSHEFLTSYTASSGNFTQAQPAFTDISGTLATGQLPAAVPVVSFGAGAPSGSSIEGFIYFNTSATPYNGYVYHGGAWQQFS